VDIYDHLLDCADGSSPRVLMYGGLNKKRSFTINAPWSETGKWLLRRIEDAGLAVHEGRSNRAPVNGLRYQD
jgi:hypothetical protein